MFLRANPHPADDKRQFVVSILAALGYEAQANWDSSAIVDEIAGLCRGMKVECFMIDEAHHLVQAGPKRTAGLQEFLKSLLNRCCTQFVLAGVPQLLVLRESEQLERRMAPVVYLDPYDWDESYGRLEFRSILEDFEEASGLEFAPSFQDQLTAARMYLATGGRLALVSKYLSAVVRRAERERLRSVGLELVGEVFASYQKPTPRSEVEEAKPFDAEPSVRTRQAFDPRDNPFLVDEKRFRAMWTKARGGEGRRSGVAEVAAANMVGKRR